MRVGSSAEARAHARKAVEDQIEVLKTHLNTLTPVALLPPELLSTIFTLVPAECFWDIYKDPVHVRSYRTNTWVRVAHVCRHWRAIALSTPRFWSYITVTTKHAADVMLARSKQAPLHIVTAVPAYSDDLQRELMSNFSRIHTLKLVGSSQEISDLFQMVTTSASMLENFKLIDVSSYYDISEPVTLGLPDGLPRLRNLDINGFPFAWDHFLFCSTLTTLVLNGRIISDPPGSFESFLSALGRMADLQVLELVHVIPKPPSGTPSRKITLTHLSFFFLQSSATQTDVQYSIWSVKYPKLACTRDLAPWAS